jgi:hypothetical protein
VEEVQLPCGEDDAVGTKIQFQSITDFVTAGLFIQKKSSRDGRLCPCLSLVNRKA